LCTLLCENPLLNEPGVTKKCEDVQPYNAIIEYSNLNIAICDIINKKEGVYLDFFDYFKPFIKENFIKNYEKIINFAIKQLNLNKIPSVIRTKYYLMETTVDYEKVINKLKNTYENIDVLL
jgi:hypothetical protein